jgi:hypothetical protein
VTEEYSFGEESGLLANIRVLREILGVAWKNQTKGREWTKQRTASSRGYALEPASSIHHGYSKC